MSQNLSIDSEIIGGRRPGRPAHRRGELESRLRELIVEGHWQPGDRLPSRRDLQARFAAAPATLDRAMERLMRDGFIRANGRRGTFVQDHLPSSCLFAMVFPAERDAESSALWAHGLYPNLLSAAQTVIAAEPTMGLSVYWGVHKQSPRPDTQRLRADLEARRLAGLIRLTPESLWPAALEIRGDLPCVDLHTPIDESVVSGVVLDLPAWHDAALAHLAAAGRRRVAYIEIGADEGRFEQLATRSARYGMRTLPCWCQPVSPSLPVAGRYLAQLLMHAPAEDRPDALIIGDSVLTAEVCRGLRLAGVRYRDDLHVISHANIPGLPAVDLEVDWLGFDLAAAVRACLERLRRPSSGVTRIPPHLLPGN